MLSFASGALAQIRFEDVSGQTGMTGYTESWGASWGDMNGDNWPDMFNQGHRDFPRFYRNTGTGIFEDVAYEMDPGDWMLDPLEDQHGASWADFDNDGDEDLMITVSATGVAQFLVNEGGRFVERAAEAGIDVDEYARLAVWFDYTRDGHLDIAQLHLSNAKLSYRDPDDLLQADYDFDQEFLAGFDCPGQLNYGQLTDVDGDGSFEFMCLAEGVFPLRVYDMSSQPFVDITATLPFESNVNNSVSADFDNDGRADLVMTRGAIRPSGASLVGNRTVLAWLRKSEGQPPGKGFDFRSDGAITVRIDHHGMGVYENSKSWRLTPDGDTVADAGPVAVRYNPDREFWEARLTTEEVMQAFVQVYAERPITGLTDVGLDNPERAFPTAHWVNNGSGYDRRYDTGLFVPAFCGGVAAGDFDNDMDVDLYLVCRRGAENLPNRLFENQGDGSFVERRGFGGEGPVGAGFRFGTGDSAVLADYDVDGFLDIYVTNGLLYYPLGKGGPDTLLRNRGNGNHWIQIDLSGRISNRDGVGAKVFATAGGVTQLREQNGGYTRWSQNHQRIHFGLAQNPRVDIRIEWPSGQVDTHTGIAADRLYDAVEGGPLLPAELGPPVFTELQPGDECGEPAYNDDYGPVALLWKDCETGTWSLRARGGRATGYARYVAGQIRGDAPFGEIREVGMGFTWDKVENSPRNTIEYAVGAWYSNNKGFDFSTGAQSFSCFSREIAMIPTLIVGASGKKIEDSFDLITLGSCERPPECGNPQARPAAEAGVFVFRNCAYPGEQERWNITITGGGRSPTLHRGQVISDMPLTSGGTSIEPGDRLDSIPGDTQVDFALNVGKIYYDAMVLNVQPGASACLIADQLPAGLPIYYGPDRIRVSGNFDLRTREPCGLPVPPEPPIECGASRHDNGRVGGLFIWRDCTVTGENRRWSVRVTGGGSPEDLNYVGSVVSQSATLAPEPHQLEVTDRLDTTPGDGYMNFNFTVRRTGIDGFDLNIPQNADACFELRRSPPGAEVALGAGNTPAAVRFDLRTLGSC